ncbi:hypothetical protein BLNAU_16978 [Blattamonas nauphoetae]|uniref:Uncharacterized protein n=1 Tax=Blattamonas nauphoetae TaxID=2049346 RepID=A0ABQ9XA61_9EUKA|nr:hypothetical protein BLNAU_16978 [Blattamonas nauphoetae]
MDVLVFQLRSTIKNKPTCIYPLHCLFALASGKLFVKKKERKKNKEAKAQVHHCHIIFHHILLSNSEATQQPRKKTQIFSYSTLHPTADDWPVSGSERVPFHTQMHPTILSRILKLDQSFSDSRDVQQHHLLTRQVPTTRFLSVHSPSFQPKGIQKMTPQMFKKAAGKGERRDDEKIDEDNVPFPPIAALPDRLSQLDQVTWIPIAPLVVLVAPPLHKPTSQPSPRQPGGPLRISSRSDLDTFFKSLMFSRLSSLFVWKLQNADILFSDFFISCTVLPAGYISTQTNGSSPSGPTLSPQHAFDQLHDSDVGWERRSGEANRAAALLSSSGGFFTQPGTVNPQKASSSSSSQNRLHFSSAVNPYSLLDPSQPPFLPTPMKKHFPHPESTGSTQKHLPPHSFSALQLVNHPVLRVPLAAGTAVPVFLSSSAVAVHKTVKLLKVPVQPNHPILHPTFLTLSLTDICDLPLIAHSPLAHSLPRKRKPENEKTQTAQQTILGTASLEPSDIDDQHSKHVADSET